MRVTDSLYALNHGVVDRRALARVDVKRLALAAQVQENWIPKEMGPMIMRPGLEFISSTRGNVTARYLPFIFANDDTALLEFTNSTMRVLIDEELLTRPSSNDTIVNGTFVTDLTGWTSYDDVGATSSWQIGGYMELLGNGTSRAIREQEVVVTKAGIERGIRIVIRDGPVTLRIGTTTGDDDLVSESTLYTGTHSFSISPSSASYFIRFSSTQAYGVFVNSCTIEAAGEVTLPTPWTADLLDDIRYDQSADVVFLACEGLQQRRIERRGERPGSRSWSVVLYESPDGPFLIQNTGPTTLAVDGIVGNVGVTSSVPMFSADHVGALFSITSIGQSVTRAASGTNQYTNPIRVVGLKTQRGINITIAGTFSATVVLQQSFDTATWADVAGKSWTAPTAEAYNDGLDNQIVYYRLGIEGTYVSGTANCSLSISEGSIRGIVRIVGVNNPTTAFARVLTALGGTAPSTVWEEGAWSDVNGWPSAVVIHEGRMWWGGKNGIDGSVSDAYDSFDETQVGDSGPISRTIGSGPLDTVNWLLSLKGLILGGQAAEYTVRSSSLDEPLTPTNFNLKASSTQGSGPTMALKIDGNGYFVDRTGVKVFELSFDIRAYDYVAQDLTELCPELGLPGIKRIAVQRKPDTRVHCVRSDGVAMVGVINRTEEVLCWVTVTTSGFVEDVVILPALFGTLDDRVYYVVRRVIDGTIVRYLEKWAQEIDTRGGQLCRLADAYTAFTVAPTTVFSVPQLRGRQVVVWADGVDVGTDDSGEIWVQRYTADSAGTVTLDVPATNVVIGLPYTASFQSAKLGLQQQGVTSLGQQKKIQHIGLVLADTHRKGVRYGPTFDVLDDMPMIEDGAPVTDEVSEEYDQNLIEFPGTWTTDSRVCIVGSAPRPATVMAVSFAIEQNG